MLKQSFSCRVSQGDNPSTHLAQINAYTVGPKKI